MTTDRREWGATALPGGTRAQWHEQLGHACQPPTFSSATDDDALGRARFARMHDVAIIDVVDAQAAGTSGAVKDAETAVRLYVVNRAALLSSSPRPETSRAAGSKWGSVAMLTMLNRSRRTALRGALGILLTGERAGVAMKARHASRPDRFLA